MLTTEALLQPRSASWPLNCLNVSEEITGASPAIALIQRKPAFRNNHVWQLPVPPHTRFDPRTTKTSRFPILIRFANNSEFQSRGLSKLVALTCLMMNVRSTTESRAFDNVSVNPGSNNSIGAVAAAAADALNTDSGTRAKSTLIQQTCLSMSISASHW